MPRFSNPTLTFSLSPDGPAHPMGVPGDAPSASIAGPADAVRVINATGPDVAQWSDHSFGTNRPPVATRTLPGLALALPGALDVDLSAAFADPDGDALTYATSTSAPRVVTVTTAGARVTLTAVSGG